MTQQIRLHICPSHAPSMYYIVATMPLPPQIITEILRICREHTNNTDEQPNEELPSPRGVADFDFANENEGDKPTRRMVKIFPNEQTASNLINRYGTEFLDDVMKNVLTVMEHCRRLRIHPGDVTRALEVYACNAGRNVHYMSSGDNVDDSPYDGSEMEVDEEASITSEGNVSFDDLYPPVDDGSIGLSDKQFKDQVILPTWIMAIWEDIRTSIAGMLKRAMYSYLVQKLLEHKQSQLDQLQEASTLVELALWKAKIGEYAADNDVDVSNDDRKQCRMGCGADIVVPNALSYLFPGVRGAN